MKVLNYQEIDGVELSPNDEAYVKATWCTNCEKEYDGRLIMVAKLAKAIRWWHYPSSNACEVEARGKC